MHYRPLSYKGAFDVYVYPLWANVLGWGIAGTCMAIIPTYIIWYLATGKGSLKQVGICICHNTYVHRLVSRHRLGVLETGGNMSLSLYPCTSSVISPPARGPWNRWIYASVIIPTYIIWYLATDKGSLKQVGICICHYTYVYQLILRHRQGILETGGNMSLSLYPRTSSGISPPARAPENRLKYVSVVFPLTEKVSVRQPPT